MNLHKALINVNNTIRINTVFLISPLHQESAMFWYVKSRNKGYKFEIIIFIIS